MPVIDLHADTADRIYSGNQKLLRNDYHIDIEKLQKGKYLAQWFALYIDTLGKQENFMEEAERLFSYFYREIEENSDKIQLATSSEEYKKIKSEGKITAFLSVEEGQIIGDNLANIDTLYNWGVRMMTLTWNYPNRLGHPHSINKGLTSFGKEVIAYLAYKGIFLDISHLSELGVKEATEIYKKPIIASHCNARALCNHTRNLSDDVIRIVAESGGVIGINFYSYFLNGSTKSNIDDMLAQVGYIYNIGGKEVLALGTDFDGIDCDMEVCNAGEMDRLMIRLADTYGEDIMDHLSHKNFENFLEKNL